MTAMLAALLLAVQGPVAAAGPSLPTCLIGRYEGSAHEVGAGLELGEDGRFSFGLSYGALDEGAEGSWQADEANVYLTSDVTVPPRFVSASDVANADSVLRVKLDLPRGMSAQYFAIAVTWPDGSQSGRQFSDDAITFPAGPGGLPVSVRVLLPVFALTSDAIAIAPGTVTPGGGRDLTVRFEPNDLGAIGFERVPLARRDGDLVLERHGREVRFRQVSGACRREVR